MEKIGWTRENFKSILNKYSYILSLNRRGDDFFGHINIDR